MKRYFLKGMFVWIALALLAAACTPAQTSTPPATTVEVPVTAATATPPAAPGPADTSNAPTLAPTTAALPGDQATATAASGGASLASGATKYVLVPDKSEASYAVREQLARLNFPSDAIGKTNAISGAIVINPDGTIDSANSKFTVDVSTLKSDSSMRDRYVMGNILQSNQYPNVVFVPTSLSGLPASLPQSGSVSFQITGNLTIRDVTKPVTWDVSGTVNNGEATGTATTSFTFEDFNLTQPRVPVVLSVVDKIALTMTLDLQPTN